MRLATRRRYPVSLKVGHRLNLGPMPRAFRSLSITCLSLIFRQAAEVHTCYLPSSEFRVWRRRSHRSLQVSACGHQWRPPPSFCGYCRARIQRRHRQAASRLARRKFVFCLFCRTATRLEEVGVLIADGDGSGVQNSALARRSTLVRDGEPDRCGYRMCHLTCRVLGAHPDPGARMGIHKSAGGLILVSIVFGTALTRTRLAIGPQVWFRRVLSVGRRALRALKPRRSPPPASRASVACQQRLRHWQP